MPHTFLVEKTMTTKTKSIIGMQWVEAPPQPKQVTQVYLKRSMPVIITPSQPVTPLIANPTEEQAHEVLIVLCQVMQNTMSKFKAHAICGNIALVEFVPVTGLDPVLPLPLLGMGWYFNRKYRQLTTHIMGYNSMTWGNEWYNIGKRLVDYLCEFVGSDRRFSEDEKRYFCKQLNLTLVKPTRGGLK